MYLKLECSSLSTLLLRGQRSNLENNINVFLLTLDRFTLLFAGRATILRINFLKHLRFSFKGFFYLLVFSLFSFKAWSTKVDKNNSRFPEVIQIFRIFNYNVGNSPSLEMLNKIAQENFLRPAKTERLSKEATAHYEKLCTSLSPHDREQLLDLFRKMGDMEPIDPKEKEYEYILINGSTVSNMRERLMYFVSLLDQKKITLKPETKIVFLTGDRNLFDSETKEELLNPTPFKGREGWQPPKTLPTNEVELGEFVWNQLDLPLALREATPLFVKAKKKPGAMRAETADTIKSFLEDHKIPQNSRFLVVSSNPYVHYQKKVTELMFNQLGYGDKGFQFDAVGSAADFTHQDKCTAIGLLMDNLARTIYMELQLAPLFSM